MARLSNFSLRKFRKFLKSVGCKRIRTKGGHKIYARNDLDRSFPIQTHVDPVPIFIVEAAARWLGYVSPEDKKKFVEEIKKV